MEPLASPDLAALPSQWPAPARAEARPCPICPHLAPNTTKLQSHVLLKHPELHLCLFCVAQKGWSDSFASQSQYHQHYWARHRGRSGQHEARLAQERVRKRRIRDDYRQRVRTARAQGRPLPKRERVGRDLCRLCPLLPPFDTDLAFHQHLMSQHGYDFCPLCRLIGPQAAVRYHIGQRHAGRLCYVCASSSPALGPACRLGQHLRRVHGFGAGAFPCPECSVAPFPDIRSYTRHALERHLTAGDALRPMRLRRGAGPEARGQRPALKRVTPLANRSGQDCFAIAIVHLLAQTELGARLDPPEHHRGGCPAASCVLGHYIRDYARGRRVVPDFEVVARAYARFQVPELPVDCGDFLRGALRAVAQCSREHRGGALDAIETAFQISLQWKFECPGCQRFMVMTGRDFVLRIEGAQAGSLAQLLNRYLHEKTCQCGATTRVYPGVQRAGEYILIEIDRNCRVSQGEEDAKEIALYSLQLEPTYHIFGCEYTVLGTVNYDVANHGGGHFITKLFSGALDLISVHEDIIQTERKKPDFDADAVIVALQRLEISTPTELKRIELEIEIETEPANSEALDKNHSVDEIAPEDEILPEAMEPPSQSGESPTSELDRESKQLCQSIDLPASEVDRESSMMSKNQLILQVISGDKL